MQRAISTVFVILGSMTAIANAKPLPGSAHQPPVVLNHPTMWINLATHDSGYIVNTAFRIIGATSSNDRIRFEWKSGGKLVGMGKCQTEYYEKYKQLDGHCSLEDNVKAIGPINIDIFYTDDQDSKEYLVTTLKTDVKTWKGIGKFQYYGIIPDDLLALSFASYNEDYRRPLFQFWTTNRDFGSQYQFRCSVDGKKLPDFAVSITTPKGQHTIESSFMNEKARRTYSFERVLAEPDFRFGKKEDKGDLISDASQVRWMIDNPGKWDCIFRVAGKPVREFLFTVNDQGMIEPSGMQKGARAVPTIPVVTLIDMKIPKDNDFEKRIRPDALKKSIGFGIPWPESPVSKELQASFPPASGLPD